MRLVRWALTIIGGLAALIGIVWIGQGSGYFPYPSSSFMINQTPWILRGAIVAIVGVAIICATRRFLKE